MFHGTTMRPYFSLSGLKYLLVNTFGLCSEIPIWSFASAGPAAARVTPARTSRLTSLLRRAMWPGYRGAEPGLPGSALIPTFRLGRTPWRPDLPWPVGLAPPGRLVASRRVAVLGKSVRVLVVHQRMHAGRPPLVSSGMGNEERRTFRGPRSGNG